MNISEWISCGQDPTEDSTGDQSGGPLPSKNRGAFGRPFFVPEAFFPFRRAHLIAKDAHKRLARLIASGSPAIFHSIVFGDDEQRWVQRLLLDFFESACNSSAHHMDDGVNGETAKLFDYAGDIDLAEHWIALRDGPHFSPQGLQFPVASHIF